MIGRRLELIVHDGRYALAHLPAEVLFPDWARGEFAAVLRSRRRTTVVCEAGAVPADIAAQAGFRCLEIGGEFELDSVGVLAAVVQPLAAAGISVFGYSSWDTDHVLIQDADLELALSVLAEAGHSVRDGP